ncbi:universal stress protein [Streptomyces sp. NBC_01142]|uniref:universal stress protein n=1 Tax=Streptomyces sp. NBC_01142 TaxID=2975865 RepID=UPI00338FE782
MARRVVVGVDGSSCSAGAADWTAREASLRRLPLRVVHVSPWSRADLADLWPYRPEALPGCPAAAITCRCPRLRVEAVRLTGCPVPALTAETGPCGSRQYRGADVRPDGVALGVDARDPADVAVCFAF